jgi:hypothetical protein
MRQFRVARLMRRLRRGTCREGRPRGRRTAVLVDLEPNHDRQNCGGLVRAQVGPPQGFQSTHPVAQAEADAVRLDKKMFRAGLTFACPNCALLFWLHLDSLKTFVQCEYCDTSSQ